MFSLYTHHLTKKKRGKKLNSKHTASFSSAKGGRGKSHPEENAHAGFGRSPFVSCKPCAVLPAHPIKHPRGVVLHTGYSTLAFFLLAECCLKSCVQQENPNPAGWLLWWIEGPGCGSDTKRLMHLQPQKLVFLLNTWPHARNTAPGEWNKPKVPSFDFIFHSLMPFWV